jgi:hypothetical protein
VYAVAIDVDVVCDYGFDEWDVVFGVGHRDELSGDRSGIEFGVWYAGDGSWGSDVGVVGGGKHAIDGVVDGTGE